MSKNPFTSVTEVSRKIGKNYYDWSHDYNFTGKIGTIYPVFAKYCPAGQSLSIDAIAGLQFMPMQFPVQSKMKMKLSVWRMPLRAMWKDYTNLVSSQNQPDVQKNYVAPYIDFNHSGAYTDMLAVGGLCDYLRIPVSIDSYPYFYLNESAPIQVWDSLTFDDFTPTAGCDVEKDPVFSPHVLGYNPTKDAFQELYLLHTAYSGVENDLMPGVGTVRPYPVRFEYRMNFSDLDLATSAFNSLRACCVDFTPPALVTQCLQFITCATKKDNDTHVVSGNYCVKVGDISLDGNSVVISTPSEFTGCMQNFKAGEYDHPYVCLAVPNSGWIFRGEQSVAGGVRLIANSVSFKVYADPQVCLNKDNSPYYDSSSPDKEKQLKLSAYPFRMYEAIYNAYIRYIRNNPFKKDGKAVYNEWLPTMEGGADTTPYKLYRCNWAADAYTTAVQSPQQGVAPVVGLSQATVMNEDGTGRVIPAITTEDGRTYGIEFKANEFGLEGVDYTELGTGAKVAPVYSMYALAQSGISIEDFRMTNAYQRYLELNMMRGYSYKQIVEGRFEVNVKYDSLLMPEFCGGMTRDVYMSGVQQNVEQNDGLGTYVGSLGSEAGLAGCRGELGNKIKVYCDEASYVMVLAYVVPQSIYSQVCPKDFLYRDLLDAWSPEFDQIGFQPIKYSELCPLQAWTAGHDNLQETFGFQRPWHEYCEVLDASVGLFNTEMRNFLMHRQFNVVPVLGEKFTTVNPESVDHVFSVTEFTDKYFGQIHFTIDVKSPVSRVVIPSLE